MNNEIILQAFVSTHEDLYELIQLPEGKLEILYNGTVAYYGLSMKTAIFYMKRLKQFFGEKKLCQTN